VAYFSISWSLPLFRSGTVPPSPPSLQPPMNWPLTNTCGTLVLPVHALSSAFWASVTSTSLNSMPASLRASFADLQKGHHDAAKTTTGAEAMTSATGVWLDCVMPINQWSRADSRAYLGRWRQETKKPVLSCGTKRN
ncbi:unnamed protein product, partial [Pelagomonas calceolata]